MFKLFKKVSVSILIITFAFPYNLSIASTTNTYTWTDQEDFEMGTVPAEIEINQAPGEVKIKQDSYTESTKEEFENGHSINLSTIISEDEDGEIILGNQNWNYSIFTDPAIVHNRAYHSFLKNNLLYISTYGGLSVIDIKDVTHSFDDTLVTTYTTSTSPAIGENRAHHSFLENNLLYVSTWGGGLSVIDTKGTTDPGDDTLVATYTTSTSPAIGDNQTNHSFLENNLLYVSTSGGGLSVIDTKGTTSPSDDTLVTTYKTSTSPAIGSNGVSHSFLENNILYVSTYGGLSVFDTKGTVDPSDDTLVTTYTTSTSPVIGSNGVSHSFLENNILYVSTFLGLSVIDTKGTVDPSDDTLVTTYTTSTSPAIGSNWVAHTLLENNILYISTWNGGGLSAIDTKGTSDPSDDTLVATYKKSSAPVVRSDSFSHVFLENNLLYGSTDNGLSVIDLSGQYISYGERLSGPFSISSVPNGLISWNASQSEGQQISVQWRTGGSEAVWRNDFDNNDASEYLGDFYGWGGPFNDAIESNGTMKIYNPSPGISEENSWVDFWLDTGKPDGYFQAGSIVKARIRINSEREKGEWNDFMYHDDWWSNQTEPFWQNNEWFEISFVPESSFSKIGFETTWKTGTWDNENDSFEIDWLQIETPDSMGHWGEWSEPCENQYGCPIDQASLEGKEWFQYKMNLSTEDTSTTPKINSVTLSDGYKNQGTYTSQTISYPETNEILSFNADTTVPEGTSITFQYSTDQGVTWNDMSSSQTFPQYYKANNFTWRATLSTQDSNKTPIIHSATLSSTQTDLNAFSVKTKEVSLNGSKISTSSENRTSKSSPTLGATNQKAKNGTALIYKRSKKGSFDKIGQAKINQNGRWTFKLPKEKEGKQTYSIRYIDKTGNQTGKSKSFSIIRDFKPPSFQKELPTFITMKAGSRIDFPATDDQGIESYEVKLLPSRKGWKKSEDFYILPEGIKSGSHMLYIKVTDKTGNKTTKTILVQVR